MLCGPRASASVCSPPLTGEPPTRSSRCTGEASEPLSLSLRRIARRTPVPRPPTQGAHGSKSLSLPDCLTAPDSDSGAKSLSEPRGLRGNWACAETCEAPSAAQSGGGAPADPRALGFRVGALCRRMSCSSSAATLPGGGGGLRTPRGAGGVDRGLEPPLEGGLSPVGAPGRGIAPGGAGAGTAGGERWGKDVQWPDAWRAPPKPGRSDPEER